MNKDIAFKALEMALKEGSNQVRISLDCGKESTISYLNGEIDKLHHSHGSSLLIQLFVDEKYGAFSTNNLEEQSLNSFIKKAIASVKMLEKDSARRLPDKEICQYDKSINLGQTDPKYDNLSAFDKEALIALAEQEVDKANPRLISIATDYDEALQSLFMIDSQGFEGELSQTLYTISTECTIRGEGDVRPQDFWYDSSMFFDRLSTECGRKAFERAIAMLGAKKIKSGKYSVIVENTVSSRLFAPIITSLSGPALQQNNSFLLNTLEQKKFSDKLSINDSPHLPGAMGATLFDGEGIATKPMKIIENGVIKTYYLNTYFANKLRMNPTIDSPSVPIFTPIGANSIEKMMQSLEKGVFITGFNGGNYNGATGDFSFGIQGFYFSKGVIVHPIKEMNITGNLLSLWNNILHIGDDARDCSRWQVPSLAFENVDLSGI